MVESITQNVLFGHKKRMDDAKFKFKKAKENSICEIVEKCSIKTSMIVTLLSGVIPEQISTDTD